MRQISPSFQDIHVVDVFSSCLKQRFMQFHRLSHSHSSFESIKGNRLDLADAVFRRPQLQTKFDDKVQSSSYLVLLTSGGHAKSS